MSSIQWTDVTDNIIVADGGGWWCRRISAGCDNCYAATLNQNTFFGGNKLDYSGQSPPLILEEKIIDKWKNQTKPKRHFVASMTDIFGEWVNREWHYKIFDGMLNAPKQTFQILTKRPEIMRNACLDWLKRSELKLMPANIWLGATCENQVTADKRIPVLLSIPASMHFLSCEPLLEDVDLKLPSVSHPAKNFWVIVGGESGKNCRPCYLHHIHSIVEQCGRTRTPVFVKQLGSNPVEERILDFGMPDGTRRRENERREIFLGDRKGGDMAEFPEYLQIRQFPVCSN
jgi:protein gp37